MAERLNLIEMFPDPHDRFMAIRDNPYYFLHGVRTLDEVDKQTPVKPFPVGLDYVKLYCGIWQREMRIAVPKSRRMKMTWTNLALYLWDTWFHIGRHNAIASKKEDDSDALIKRCLFMAQNLDKDIIPVDMLPKWTEKYGELAFPELNSKLEGFAQGPDQMRQYTFSGMLFDELAFWEQAEESYSAAFPTLEGGGRMTAISSPGPGFFKRMVFDKLDTMQELRDEDYVSANRKYPIEGVEIWKNPKNKFCIFQLHFKADPAKRSEEFSKNMSSAMPRRKYLQEYELSWESWAGLPVYGEWDQKIHGTRQKIHPIPGLPLLRGWDFGLTPACVIAQLQENQLVILREFTEINMGIDRFSEKVLKACFNLYPEWPNSSKAWMDFIDPAGNGRKDTDEGTCAKIMISKGITPVGGALQFEERREAVEHFLTRHTRTGPCFKVILADCPVLVRGFNGGYRYPDKATEIEPTKIRPLKDEYSHVHDALQYLCSRVRMMTRYSSVYIPPPRYSL